MARRQLPTDLYAAIKELTFDDLEAAILEVLNSPTSWEAASVLLAESSDEFVVALESNKVHVRSLAWFLNFAWPERHVIHERFVGLAQLDLTELDAGRAFARCMSGARDPEIAPKYDLALVLGYVRLLPRDHDRDRVFQAAAEQDLGKRVFTYFEEGGIGLSYAHWDCAGAAYHGYVVLLWIRLLAIAWVLSGTDSKSTSEIVG